MSQNATENIGVFRCAWRRLRRIELRGFRPLCVLCMCCQTNSPSFLLWFSSAP